jgi:hypothetical protein
MERRNGSLAVAVAASLDSGQRQLAPNVPRAPQSSGYRVVAHTAHLLTPGRLTPISYLFIDAMGRKRPLHR